MCDLHFAKILFGLLGICNTDSVWFCKILLRFVKFRMVLYDVWIHTMDQIASDTQAKSAEAAPCGN